MEVILTLYFIIALLSFGISLQFYENDKDVSWIEVVARSILWPIVLLKGIVKTFIKVLEC